jgi:hypothetical protein
MSRPPLPIGTLVAWSALVVVLVVVGWSLPIDDFWLSIASGRAIAEGADPTRALHFSWTEEVPGALNPQWGAQVLLGWHGSLGVALAVNAALIGIGLGVTAMRSAARARGVIVAAAMLIVLAALAPHLLARAQSFSIALLPLALLLLERFGRRGWMPIVYGLLMVAWANLHGGFVIGQVAAVAWLVGAVVTRQGIGVAAATAVVAVVAPLANPVGVDLLAYAYGQPASEIVTSISVEWQPSWPWIPVATPFWVVIAVLVAGRFVRRPGASVFELLLLIALAALAISAVRHIPWFLLASAPLLAEDLNVLVDRAPRARAALGNLPRSLIGARLGRLIGVVSVAALAFQLVRPVLPPALARLTPDEPARQVRVLEEEAESGDRVLNEQVWGGYLAYRIPRIATAMDGRLEIRSRETWAQYFALIQGRDDPAGELAARNVTWVLIGTDRDALRAALDDEGWRVVDEDDYAILMTAP